MADLRLYMFESGTLKTELQNINMNQGLGEEYTIPVPWFLITHPKGNVIIDGGNAAECVTDPYGHWGGVAKVFFPQMSPEQACVPALQSLGIDLTSVRYIIQSHLHLDHTGAVAAIESFPNAKLIATRREYEYAHAADGFAKSAYIMADFVKPGIEWFLIDWYEDGWDVFGDGTLRCWHSPGHSPGHQSFEVTLPGSGSMLLTVDAAYTLAHWQGKALPGFMTSVLETSRSVAKLRRIADRSGSTIVTGHDPEAWPEFRHAPEFYD